MKAKKLTAAIFSTGFIFVAAGCGGQHAKIEEKVDESGKETGRMGFSKDPQALMNAQDQQIQAQQGQQQQPAPQQ